MKTSLAIVGTLASIYAIAAAVQFVVKVASESPVAIIAASEVPICVGLLVAVACFDRVLRVTRN
jgi:hypothetical protein